MLKWILLFFILIINSAHAANLTLYASENFSGLRGYEQIPAGGMPGSSSIKRPDFSELNMNNISFAEFGFTYDPTKWIGIFGEYQHIRQTKDNTVNQNLISHNIFIPTSTTITTDNKFDLYFFGINHKWYFLNEKIALSPEIELTLLDFSYEFFIPEQYSQRAFHATTGRIGLNCHYFINEDFSLFANIASSIPNASNLQVFTANIDVARKVFTYKTIQTSLFFGLAYEEIDFEDSQELPNHINLKLAPIAQIGIKVYV